MLTTLVDLQCEWDMIVQTDHNATLNQNLEVRNAEDGKEAIQLKPQEMTIKLRPSKKFCLAHLDQKLRQSMFCYFEDLT